MPNAVEPCLIDTLMEELQKERFALLATIDYETGGPNLSAISWLFARDPKTIYFATDSRSRIVKNIENNNRVSINVIANESSYSISGFASVRQEKLENVPLKLALMEVAITEVRDVMFYGSKMTHEPGYDKTYDKEAAARLDAQVMDALRRA